jgi:hypothetical protein
MIAEAAYFRAAKRGFEGGDPAVDWVEAEIEVDARLREVENGQLLERLEEGLEIATKRINAIRRKASGLASDTRTEMQRDLAKLGELRDALRAKVKELRVLGEQAGHKARAQAEKVRDDLADAIQRLTSKKNH